MLLVGALVLSGALERLGQQRVREHLARDPLGVQRVGLAALARAIRPRRAVRAHIAHVMAAADQEHRRVPAPARRPLDPPAGDLPELPRPRLQLAVPLARDTKVLRGQNPAARVGDRRGQRPLMRIDPDHVASMIGREQQVRRSRTALLRSFSLLALTSRRMLLRRIGRQHPGGRPSIGANAPIRSGRSSKARTEADTSSARHPSPGSQSRFRVRPRFSLRPYANRRPRGHQDSTPGSLSQKSRAEPGQSQRRDVPLVAMPAVGGSMNLPVFAGSMMPAGRPGISAGPGVRVRSTT